MLKLGENLKKLRLQKGQTQEQLAEAMGVSPQAISRWENGTTYPDITILPSIVNYFEITLDEFFDMDEIRSTERINAIFKQAHEYENNDDIDKAVEILRNAVKTYPNNYGLLSELALALSYKNDTASINEAIEFSEKVLQCSTNEKVRSTARANLCFLYLKSEQRDKAASLAKTLPHIWECREMLSVNIAEADKRNIVLKQSINTALTVICDLIDKNMDNNIFALGADYGQQADIEAMLNKISLFLK